MEEKKRLRKEIRQQLRNLSDEKKLAFSASIIAQLEATSEFQDAQTILFFWSLPDEVQTHDVINQTFTSKTILLPVVIGDDTEIRQFQGLDHMQKGAFDIEEPTGEPFTDYDKIDLVVVPGLGFDLNGNRLGRGKGYYDKLLAKIPAPTIAICYPCQLVQSVPHEEWDIRIDRIITTDEMSDNN